MGNNDNFIKVANDFFKKNKDGKPNTLELIGTEGLVIYCYLLYRCSVNETAEVSIKMVQAFLNRNNGKEKQIDGLKDKRTILKYLLALQRNELITVLNGLDEKVGINDILIISCRKHEGGFSSMPERLFVNEIPYIGHIGFSILCLLTKLYNPNFGEGNGFACPPEDYIARVIGRHVNTVKIYLGVLKERKLIKIRHQKPLEFVDQYGVVNLKPLPNRYIVMFQDINDKYFSIYCAKKSIKREEKKKKKEELV